MQLTTTLLLPLAGLALAAPYIGLGPNYYMKPWPQLPPEDRPIYLTDKDGHTTKSWTWTIHAGDATTSVAAAPTKSTEAHPTSHRAAATKASLGASPARSAKPTHAPHSPEASAAARERYAALKKKIAEKIAEEEKKGIHTHGADWGVVGP